MSLKTDFGQLHSDYFFIKKLFACQIVLGLHSHHGEEDGGVGGLHRQVTIKSFINSNYLGHIGPASEGLRVEGLGHASKCGLRHLDQVDEKV